jgi:sec-independent protein translocase protein TatA
MSATWIGFPPQALAVRFREHVAGEHIQRRHRVRLLTRPAHHIVLVIALLVLGPKRLPDAAKSLGSGLREFKRSISGANDDARVASTVESPVDSSAPVDGGAPNRP